MSTPEAELVLRSDDPRCRQVEADGWEVVATSWGARLELDPADPEALARLGRLATPATDQSYLVREAVRDDIPQMLGLDARTAADYPGGVATHHEPLDAEAAHALLERGRAWGVWYAEELVALTVAFVVGDLVETDFTAVHPDHRGRGLATAVKATSVLAYAEQGRALFGTGGADSNLASLAMNRAVGYRITETWHTYRRPAADLAVRGRVTDEELNGLHAAAFGHEPTSVPWNDRLGGHSLTWVTARVPGDGTLVGFVNVVGDGGAHAILLDTMVHPDLQGRGVGRSLVRSAAREGQRLGCHWLHADYEEGAAAFYERSCGLVPTRAGLLRLQP